MSADIPACRGRPVLPGTIGTRPGEKLMATGGQILTRGDRRIYASAYLTRAPRVCMPFVCIERPYKRLFPTDRHDPMHSKLLQSRPEKRVNTCRKVFSNLTLQIWPQILKTRTRNLLIFAVFFETGLYPYPRFLDSHPVAGFGFWNFEMIFAHNGFRPRSRRAMTLDFFSQRPSCLAVLRLWHDLHSDWRLLGSSGFPSTLNIRRAMMWSTSVAWTRRPRFAHSTHKCASLARTWRRICCQGPPYPRRAAVIRRDS